MRRGHWLTGSTKLMQMLTDAIGYPGVSVSSLLDVAVHQKEAQKGKNGGKKDTIVGNFP